MALVVNTNVSSLLAQHRLAVNNNTLARSLERLSSGFRINRAADDAAGLTISQNLVSQIKRMNQSLKNAQDGISVLQTAEGSLQVIGDNLQRVRELAVQAANDTYDATGRATISAEIRSLLEDIDRMARASQFNGTRLLDGTATNAVLQVGPNSSALTNTVDITGVLTDATSAGLALVGGTQTFATVAGVNIASSAQARSFMADVDAAIRNVNIQRANIGSFQNKLESVNANLELAVENFSTSNSRIRDVDVAEESATMVQYQILTQAATMVLSQTNQLPQQILSLLQR